MYGGGGGGGGVGAEDFRGALRGGCLFSVRFCLAFVIVLKSEKRK